MASLGSFPGESSSALLLRVLGLRVQRNEETRFPKAELIYWLGLFLVIPFSMLAKHVDRHLLLVVNAVSILSSNVFMSIMGTSVHLKLLFPVLGRQSAYHQRSCSTHTKCEPQSFMASKPFQPFRRRGCCLLHIAA